MPVGRRRAPSLALGRQKKAPDGVLKGCVRARGTTLGLQNARNGRQVGVRNRRPQLRHRGALNHNTYLSVHGGVHRGNPIVRLGRVAGLKSQDLGRVFQSKVASSEALSLDGGERDEVLQIELVAGVLRGAQEHVIEQDHKQLLSRLWRVRVRDLVQQVGL